MIKKLALYTTPGGVRLIATGRCRSFPDNVEYEFKQACRPHKRIWRSDVGLRLTYDGSAAHVEIGK